MPLNPRQLEAFSRKVERELECLSSETHGMVAAGIRRHVARRLRFSVLHETLGHITGADLELDQSSDFDLCVLQYTFRFKFARGICIG